jgi:hypothetical protein
MYLPLRILEHAKILKELNQRKSSQNSCNKVLLVAQVQILARVLGYLHSQKEGL